MSVKLADKSDITSFQGLKVEMGYEVVQVGSMWRQIIFLSFTI